MPILCARVCIEDWLCEPSAQASAEICVEVSYSWVALALIISTLLVITHFTKLDMSDAMRLLHTTICNPIAYIVTYFST